jgi:hypothetical protein
LWSLKEVSSSECFDMYVCVCCSHIFSCQRVDHVATISQMPQLSISQIPQQSLKCHNYLSNTTILIMLKYRKSWIESKGLLTSCKVFTLAVCDMLQTNSPVGALVRAPPLLCAGLSGRIAEGPPFARRHLVLSDPQRRLVTQRLISKRVAGVVVTTRTLL